MAKETDYDNYGFLNPTFVVTVSFAVVSFALWDFIGYEVVHLFGDWLRNDPSIWPDIILYILTIMKSFGGAALGAFIGYKLVKKIEERKECDRRIEEIRARHGRA